KLNRALLTKILGPTAGLISGDLLTRDRWHVFVFPSFFEGFGLVLLEAMACGLPVITTNVTAGSDILCDKTGKIVSAGDVDALVESLRWFAVNRERLHSMRYAVRARAETCSWERYRQRVSEAVAAFV